CFSGPLPSLIYLLSLHDALPISRIPGTSYGRALLRVLHLFPNGREKSPDPNLTGGIGNECRNRAAAVGVDGVSGPGFTCAGRLRSEERRVGKGWRAWRARGHEKV